MQNVHVLGNLAQPIDPGLLDASFKLRYEVFYKQLNWDVPTNNGLEYDNFDQLEPAYVMSHNKENVDGVMRLLPTTGPYMLKDVFPQLLGDTRAPEDESIWEVSRFAVHPGSHSKRTAKRIADVALRFAADNGITRYVFATTAAFEDWLTSGLGLRVKRFATPVMIGQVSSVGCWLDIPR